MVVHFDAKVGTALNVLGPGSWKLCAWFISITFRVRDCMTAMIRFLSKGWSQSRQNTMLFQEYGLLQISAKDVGT